MRFRGEWSALLEGGSSGIGYATAQLFYSKGAKVSIFYTTPPKSELPPGMEFMQLDRSSWKTILATLKQRGEFDFAVTNAGIGREPPIYLDDSFDENSELEELIQDLLIPTWLELSASAK